MSGRQLRSETLVLVAAGALGIAAFRPGSRSAAAPQLHDLRRGTPGVATAHATVSWTEMARRPPPPGVRLGAPEHPGMPHRGPFPPDEARTVYRGTVGVASPLRRPVAPLLTTSSSFLAVTASGNIAPPDSDGAVGPNHLLVAVNSEVIVQTKTGANATAAVTPSQFFASVLGTNNTVFDPHVRYDPYGQRFLFAMAAENYDSNTGKTLSSSILIAASQTSDPTGAWNLFSISTGAAYILGDYLMLGFNKDWAAVSVNLFNFSGSLPIFTGPRIFAFDKAALYANTGSGTHTTFTLGSTDFAVQPASTYDPSLATLYFLENHQGSAGTLRLFTLTGAVGSEAFGLSTTITSATTWNDNTGPLGAPQSGTTVKIATIDSRIESVVYRNGALWAAQTIALPPSTPTRTSVQVWQVSPAGTVMQQMRVDDATATNFYAFPSVAVNAWDDAVVGFSAFSAATFASAGYSYHGHSDAANALQSPAVLEAGGAIYTVGAIVGTNARWGDFSTSAVDPANDSDLWTIQEYATSTVSHWGTWWGHFSPPTPPPTPTTTTTPTPTLTPTTTPTPTITPTATPTFAPTSTPTRTPTPTPTPTCSVKGDVDGNGKVDVLDVFFLINYLFANGPPPVCSADANGDGKVDVTDVFYLINFLFAQGAPPH